MALENKICIHTAGRRDQRPAAGSRNDAQRRIISAQSDKILEDHGLHVMNIQADKTEGKGRSCSFL